MINGFISTLTQSDFHSTVWKCKDSFENEKSRI